MIVQANLLDSNGFIIEPVVVFVYDVLEVNVIKEVVPEGIYTPRWDYETKTWVESVTLSELLNPLREAKVDQLNNDCQIAITEGFEHNGDVFQFNDKDQVNFNQQLSLILLDDSLNEVVWKTENNGVKIFTRQEFIETCKAGEFHKRNNIGNYWQLKEYVMTHDFKSVEELNDINFNFVIGTKVGS